MGNDKILGALEKKVLWLATWMIHNANHLRDSEDGLKVGGHQASSASLPSFACTSFVLWRCRLCGADSARAGAPRQSWSAGEPHEHLELAVRFGSLLRSLTFACIRTAVAGAVANLSSPARCAPRGAT
jgi:hypothetical protein